MVTRYISFGVGSVLGKSFLVAHGTSETEIRIALNCCGLPWCSCYTRPEFTALIEKYHYEPLPCQFEAFKMSPHDGDLHFGRANQPRLHEWLEGTEQDGAVCLAHQPGFWERLTEGCMELREVNGNA